jgi:hypothetical protein
MLELGINIRDRAESHELKMSEMYNKGEK